MHELLTRLGASVEVHPNIPGTTTHPDFRADFEGSPVYVEAVDSNPPSSLSASDPLEDEVLDTIDDLDSPKYFITVETPGKLSTAPPHALVVRPFAELMASHDPDEVQHLIDAEGFPAASASLAQELLGLQRDDTVTLQDGIEKLSYRIADIQSKYVRAFQETASGFPTRFPRNTDLSSIPVAEDDFTNFLSVIDKQDRFVRELQELYRDEPVPFALLCARLGRPAPELWRTCTAGDGLRIRFSTGSAKEAEKGQELLRDADSIVLDMLALLTTFELKLTDRLRRRFDRVTVPQGVIDELRSLVIETSVGARPSGHMGRNIDGTYALIEMSEEEWGHQQDFACSVLSLAESFDPIASYPELNVDSNDIEQFSGLVTEAGVSSIFAGGEDPEDRPLLVSDDLGLANLARGFGVEAVNTQAVLQELRRVGELTDQEYSSLIARLVALNYRFLQVEPADILRLLEANGFRTDERTRALLSTLEGPECTPESAVSVVAGLIAALALIPLPEHQEPLLVSVLLWHLRHGRETTTVLEDCLRELRLRLELAPLAQARISSLVTQYIRIVGG